MDDDGPVSGRGETLFISFGAHTHVHWTLLILLQIPRQRPSGKLFARTVVSRPFSVEERASKYENAALSVKVA